MFYIGCPMWGYKRMDTHVDINMWYHDIKSDPSPSCLSLVQPKWGTKIVSRFEEALHPALQLGNARATERNESMRTSAHKQHRS